MMTAVYASPVRSLLSAAAFSAVPATRWVGVAIAALWLAVALPANAQDGMEIVPININEASVEVLTELPGIGPSKAQTIVTDREANGPFSSLEDLTRVSGIGDTTVEQLKGEVTF